MKEGIPIIILTGPTAVGKTALSVRLAKSLNAEIISADAFQIYKHMDIGSAKVTPEEMEGVRHYLVDCIDPHEEFTVSDFKREAEKAIAEISGRGKNIIFTGGTGLYLNSIIYDMDFAQVKEDKGIRAELTSLYEREGADYIYELLKSEDPHAAERIHKNNVKRVIRALEVSRQGSSMNDFSRDLKESSRYKPIIIVLDREKSNLNERIYKRVDLMIEAGLIEEVEALKNTGLDPKKNTSLQGIGYKEVFEYIDGNIGLEELSELIKIRTRQYAKRQRTWFRRYKDAKTFMVDTYDDEESLFNDVYRYISENL